MHCLEDGVGFSSCFEVGVNFFRFRKKYHWTFSSKRENNILTVLLIGSTFNQLHVVMEKVGLLC